MLTKSYNYTSKAFTLIELLVVISIIGLLSSVVFASVNSARERGSVAAGQKFDAHTHSAFFDDLVVSWDFDRDIVGSGVVQDLSGNGNNLAYTSNSPGLNSTFNPFNKGYSFGMNASGDARTGTIPSGTIIAANLKKPPSGDFSISFWLYPTVYQVADYLAYYSVTTDKGWRFLYATGSGFSFIFYSGGAQTASVGQLPLNKWHHITAICNSGTVGIYVNGKQTGVTDTVSSCGFMNNRPLEVSGNQLYYIDNIRIYSKALPLSFIKEQYFAELPEFKDLSLHRSISKQ